MSDEPVIAPEVVETLVETPEISAPSPKEPGAALQKATGPLALLLLFCASAGLTTAYFVNTSAAQAQAAAAAQAAAEASDPFRDIPLEAESAYVLDLTNGHVLYSKNEDVQLPLASITKVALALAVSEALSPDNVITIPYDTAPPGSAERLGKGERWRVGDVLTFTLVASSNGGADILASAADEGIRLRHPQAPAGAATLWRMNDLARELGLTRTYFLNDNGLDVSTTQAGAYGSARDVAGLLSYAVSNNPSVFAGTARDGLLLTSIGGSRTSAFNTNQALGSIPGLVMGKTGYTDLAGGNLGIVFDAGPAHPVVAVVLHSSEAGRFQDMRHLVSAALEAIAQGR